MTIKLPANTATAIKNFDKLVKSATSKTDGTEKQIMTDIHALMTRVPDVTTEKQIKQVLAARKSGLEACINRLFLHKMTRKFAIIHDELFELKRKLFLKGKHIVGDSLKPDERIKDAKQVTVPLFVYTDIDNAGGNVEIGMWTTQNYRMTESGSQYRSGQTEHRLNCKVPAAPAAIIDGLHKAVGGYMRVMSELYQTPGIGQLVRASGLDVHPTLAMTFIPTVAQMNLKTHTTYTPPPPPKRVDPASIMVIDDHKFLVGLWDANEEEPFEAILREYTSGAIPEKTES